MKWIFFKEVRNCLKAKITEQTLNQEDAYCKAKRKLLSLTDRTFYKGYQAALYTLTDIYINFMEGNADAD